ncbi:hypothetical protein M404DRAFT_492948 [Pisolithus tinctorius Marx 270]|uniref:Uncharacterized protein n=1 Tax=Pisolithus tinctorius Marx 270 TaxID=870435 RepID=A0A0C3PD95_PISTI|nr:hypothetical protein M404DRAFT_492948 [Pisolithus tinctorius Marx 270]
MKSLPPDRSSQYNHAFFFSVSIKWLPNFKQATVKENLASVRMTSVRQMLSSTSCTIADTRIHGSQSLTLLIEQVSKDIIGCTTSDHQLHYTLSLSRNTQLSTYKYVPQIMYANANTTAPWAKLSDRHSEEVAI